ncbi:MAG: response regulator [Nitrospirota bacterium]
MRGFKKGRILVVDDEAELLNLLRDFLTELGYDVTTCNSGEEALEILREHAFDVLLTDLLMPGMNGIQLIKAAVEANPILVCIVITGRATIQTAVEAMRCGAFDYLQKPLEWKTLAPVITRAMEVRKLREAEEKYRTIVEDYQTEFICRFLFDGTLTYVNEAYCRYFGKKKEDLIGRSFMDFVPEGKRESVRKILALPGQRNPVVSLEHPVIAPNGETCWQRWTCRAIFDKHGQFVEFQAIGRDITDRKQNEEKLRQSRNRLRDLTMRLTEVTEAERQILARELHDQIGQNLTALGINLNMIRSQMSDDRRQAIARVDDSLALVDQTSQRIRDLMGELRPSVIDDYGLLAALRWYGDQFSKRTGINLLVEGEELSSRLPQVIETTLFRIIQEALTNVSKHAKASEVCLTLKEIGKKVQITIKDDGRGFKVKDLRRLAERPRWGIITMRERAEAIGGNLRLESSPGKGTTVIIETSLEQKVKLS